MVSFIGFPLSSLPASALLCRLWSLKENRKEQMN